MKPTKASKFIQGLALVTLIALVAIDGFLPDFEVPIIIYGGVVGVAIGLDSEDIVGRIFRSK